MKNILNNVISKIKADPKKFYIIMTLILMGLPIAVSLYLQFNKITLSKPLGYTLSYTFLAFQVGFAGLTIWYGLRTGLKKIWAYLLGLGTLLSSLVGLISIFILLRREPTSEKSEARVIVDSSETIKKKVELLPE